jgi:5'-3' exonuclease
MTALIDADIVAYRCAASAEGDPHEIALLRVDKLMMDILEKEDNHISFLSGENNFRYEINPQYKANRKDRVDPRWLDICRGYLIDEYKAIVVNGIEADDALGIHQKEETVIYSIDKDLLMIPGHHYNFVKKEYREVSELDGFKAFYRQMLIGDSADNIFGVPKIGKVKAAKIIDSCTSENEMREKVYDLYYNPLEENWQERYRINADCLWIMRKEGERFSSYYENNNSGK